MRYQAQTELAGVKNAPAVKGNRAMIYFEADLGAFVKGKEFSALNITRSGATGMLLAINNRDRWFSHVSYDPKDSDASVNFSKDQCREIIQKAIDLPDLQVKILSIILWEAEEKVANCLQQGRVFIGDAERRPVAELTVSQAGGIADTEVFSPMKIGNRLDGRMETTLFSVA
ncbi:FAD-dependent monooxygenase [Virgibacillus halophilus]|uniref:FAD-dependent monooxygenase n=1 Tax=Tigheibacillus halophilus TaxID=361280 RepID=A0ABU5C834_9BACI|nr:FAD-dependent monooxygenase [Virgibacillus halophilus]